MGDLDGRSAAVAEVAERRPRRWRSKSPEAENEAAAEAESLAEEIMAEIDEINGID